MLDVRVTPTLGAQCTQGNYMSRFISAILPAFTYLVVKKENKNLFQKYTHTASFLDSTNNPLYSDVRQSDLTRGNTTSFE